MAISTSYDPYKQEMILREEMRYKEMMSMQQMYNTSAPPYYPIPEPKETANKKLLLINK